MIDLKQLKTIKEVESVLRLVSYDKRFLEGFAKLAKPFKTFTKKEMSF